MKRRTLLYHLADGATLPAIRLHGLSPSASRGSMALVYFAGDPGHALGYANHHGDWRGRPVLLQVDAARLDQILLHPDDADLPDMLNQARRGRDWSECSWRDSLRICGQCAYAGVVSPHLLTEVSLQSLA